MVLAEALLRVPDAATADRLIEDKLATGDWSSHEVKSNALLVSASAWTLGITARIIQPGETPGHHPGKPHQAPRPAGGARGDAPGDAAPGLAFRARADHRGGARRAPARTASCAIPSTCWARARAPRPTPSAISPPMRTPSRPSARSAGDDALPDRPGISVKLSALHPRFEAVSREPRAARAGAEAARARPQGARSRSQFHRRCRGGRPARAHARRDRGGARRPVAARLGGLRARGAGLSEARAGGDRLARRDRRARSAAA